MKKSYLAILCLAAAMVSCSKDESALTPSDSIQKISIDPMIQTRATELNFEQGDQIGLSVIMTDDSSIYFENEMMQYDGTNFTSENLFWYSGAETSTLVAYYPYTSGDALPESFTVKADQTATGAYTASDLMMASLEDATPSSDAATMTFSHSLSRIVVDASKINGVSAVTIGGVYATASIDVTAASVTVDKSDATIEISAPLWDDNTYKAIIIPQSAALTITVDFSDGTTESVETAYMYFSAGKEHTATLSMEGETLSISVSGEVDAWQDGGSIADAVSFEEFDTYFVYDGTSYNFATIGGVTIMTDNLCYIPAGMSVSQDTTDGNGLWYPCALTTDDAGAVTAAADTADASKGYLYNFSTAMGGEEFTTENYDTFEGAQGLCPKGWHIPTFDEWFALCGQALSTSDDTTAPFYDNDGDAYGAIYSSIIEANKVGFNFTFSGAIVSSKYNTTTVKETYTSTTNTPAEKSVGDASFVGEPGVTYYMTSSARTSTTLWVMMSAFTHNTIDGKFSLLSGASATGQVVRCVRDTAK